MLSLHVDSSAMRLKHVEFLCDKLRLVQKRQACHFSFDLTLVLSLPLCPLLCLSFYLKLSGRNRLLSPPVLSYYNGSPDTRFSRGTTRLMSWPDGERCLRPPLSLVVRDVAAAPQTPNWGGGRPTLGAQVSLKLLFGYVTIFSSADLFTTDLNCRKKLACDIISECDVILSRRI